MQKNNERKTFADKGENLKFWDKYLFERKCLTVYLQHFNEEKSKNSPKREKTTFDNILTKDNNKISLQNRTFDLFFFRSHFLFLNF